MDRDLQLPERIPDDADWLVIPRPAAVPGRIGESATKADESGDPVAGIARLDLILRTRKRRIAEASIPASAIGSLVAELPATPARRLRRALRRLAEAPAQLTLADGRRLALATHADPLLMGIVNVTPDSFSDGGRHFDTDRAIAHGRRLAEEGAAILDVGGESTRPGAEPVPVDEELRRVVPVIEALARDGFVVSIDSRKAAVMEAAVDAGAAIINDVSALAFDHRAIEVVATRGVPAILMHAKGEPARMQRAPHYGDVLIEVFDHLEARVRACEAAGIARDRLIVDPGIGFGKTLEHNLVLLRDLAVFRQIGVPVLLGASRKRFIGALSGEPHPERRLAGSLAAAIAGWQAGAMMLRVHDVAETRQALTVARAIAMGA